MSPCALFLAFATFLDPVFIYATFTGWTVEVNLLGSVACPRPASCWAVVLQEGLEFLREASNKYVCCIGDNSFFAHVVSAQQQTCYLNRNHEALWFLSTQYFFPNISSAVLWKYITLIKWEHPAIPLPFYNSRTDLKFTFRMASVSSSTVYVKQLDSELFQLGTQLFSLWLRHSSPGNVPI